MAFKLSSISKSNGKIGNHANPSDLSKIFGAISGYNHGNPADFKNWALFGIYLKSVNDSPSTHGFKILSKRKIKE